ncbi:MAG TPA: cyclohexanecarboxylate-CoA ligase, partial [Gammaproteobacteria bacterium]|nr:cyclohexanecarboxylate-CoA ligase [Gammaproteobacteria bacterium]
MDFAPILPKRRIMAMRRAGVWPDRLVTDYLDEAARRDSAAPAVVENNSMTGQVTRLSYGELRTRSIRIACALAALGVERGHVVALQAPNWWHYPAVYAACVRIGAVINPLMPIFRERELEFMLGLAEARVLIVPREFRGFDYVAMAKDLKDRLPTLKHVLVIGGKEAETAFETSIMDRAWETEIDYDALFHSRRPDPNDVTEIMYTSGTTGEPKGVMHTS